MARRTHTYANKSAWEAGYAFAKGKKVLVVEVDGEVKNEGAPAVQSLMMSNGCYATIRGLDALEHFDFSYPKPQRTDTEQK